MLKRTDTTGQGPKLEGGTLRPDGTVRPVVKVKAGWVGDLEQQQYKARADFNAGKQIMEERQRSGPIGGQLVGGVQPISGGRGKRGPVGGQPASASRGGGHPSGDRRQPVGGAQPSQKGRQGRGGEVKKKGTEAVLEVGLQQGLSPEEIQAKIVEKEISKLTQKLKEVTLLEQKIASGYEANPAQKEKLAKKPEFEDTLKKLTDQRTEIKEKI